MQFDTDLQSIQEMREEVKRAKEAQHQFQSFSQEQVDHIVQAMADAAYEQAHELAKLAVEETGLGVIEHKLIKNQVASRDVYLSIKDEKTVGLISEIPDRKIIEVASPFGVIAAIVPVTNPTSTAIFKCLIAVKSLNAIVFSPHPSAANCTIQAAKICMQAAKKAGAPDGLIGWITKPTMEATENLMKHKDVSLILSTGGSGLVRAAYSSGKPAYGVGPGNVPVYIEKTAEISKAVKRIIDSKTFDNGTICASEQAILVDKNIKEMVVREFKNQGSYFLNEEEKEKLEKIISPSPGKLNPSIVGKSATVIAQMAGVTVPAETRLLIAYEMNIGKDFPFSIEKLSPLFAFYTVEGWEKALDLCDKLLSLGGKGHTLALHTTDHEVAKTFALKIPVSRIVVNTPSAIGAIGGTTGLKPSMTLGCGTFGGNITSDNITAYHLMNKKRLAYGLKDINLPPAGEVDKQQYHSKQIDSISPTEEKEIEEIVEQVLAKIDRKTNLDKHTVSKLVQEIMVNTK